MDCQWHGRSLESIRYVYKYNTYVYTYIYILHIYIYTYIYIYIYIHMYTCIYMSNYLCVFVHTCAHLYIYIFTLGLLHPLPTEEKGRVNAKPAPLTTGTPFRPWSHWKVRWLPMMQVRQGWAALEPVLGRSGRTGL